MSLSRLRNSAPPVPQVVVSPRTPVGPTEVAVPVDPHLLAVGDHNGSTYYQHMEFLKVVRGERAPEVTLEDGLIAVRMGLAAQASAISGEAVRIG